MIIKEKKFWVGVLSSLLFGFLFAYKVPWHEVYSNVKNTQYIWLIPSVFFLLLSFLFRAFRWRIYLLKIKDIPATKLLPALFIGFMGNSLLPMRMGEFIRAYVLGKTKQISISTSLATIVVERIFDGFALIVLFIFILLFLSFGSNNTANIPTKLLHLLLAIFLLFNLLILLLLIYLRRKPDKTIKLLVNLFSFLPTHWLQKIEHLLHSFVDGLSSLQNIRQILIAGFYSLFVWLAITLNVYFILVAFGLGSSLGHLGIFAAIFQTVIIAMAVAIPAAPGYIGTYDKASQWALSFFSAYVLQNTTASLPIIDLAKATGITLILHASQMIPIILVGLIYLWKENISLAKIKPEPQAESETHLRT